MIIGVPKEIMHGEGRVSATPETVAMMVKDGFTVLAETGCGRAAFFADEEYAAAGAELVADPAEIYARAELILKVKEPLFNEAKNMHEIEMMHSGQYLITFIHPASPANFEMVRQMAAKGIIGITLDGIPRITRAQKMDALSSMSTCAGYKGSLIAANDLTKFVPMITCAVGMIKPINALVIGAGVAGLRAIATLRGLGAKVSAADIRPDAAEQAASLGAKRIDLGVPVEKAVGQGGYALALDADTLARERQILAELLPEMDIVFCSALVPSKIAPLLISEEMVKSMKPGSVIVDISIDQGGNCELTPFGGNVVKHGVTIEGIKNIPGMLPTSSTWMFSRNIYELLKYLAPQGQVVLDTSDEIVAGVLTTIDGQVVHAGAREAMGL